MCVPQTSWWGKVGVCVALGRTFGIHLSARPLLCSAPAPLP